MTESELIALFGDDFLEVIEAIEAGLPPAMEGLVLNTMSKVHFDTLIFGNRITQYSETLIDQGVKTSFISKALQRDLKAGGRIFGELNNAIKANLKELVNQAGRLGQMETYGDKYKEFIWITVSGHRVCNDCEGRAGTVLTFEEWESEGLPGSGWSICRGYCYCVLDPTGTLSKKVDAPGDIKEPGYSIK
tara:strand:- start:963 stop:1532 length:570 start_codon:yes stop_codon:yes gene_type:complete